MWFYLILEQLEITTTLPTCSNDTDKQCRNQSISDKKETILKHNKKDIKVKKFILIFLILSTISAFANTDKGGIKGKIVDFKTGEELIGVNVFINSTNLDNTSGSVTDLEGNYTLPNLSPGKYEIKIMYVSYKSEVIKDIFVKQGSFTVVNKILEEEAMGLDEIVVRGKKVTRTANAVLTVQKKSANVLAGISSEEMTLQGSSDVASSLKKITGVTITGGKYANVRGLEDKYVTTEIDGLAVPSMDPAKDAVQLDIFPSAIVDNILVYKSFSPDLPGNFAGGYINIKTKDFPDEFYFNASNSIEYNEKTTFKNMLTYKGGSLDWLAMDDGSRDVPSYVQKGVPPRGYDDTRLTKVTKAFNKEMSPTHESAPLNHSHSISFGDKKSLFGKTIGYNASLSYRRKFKYFNDGYVGKAKLRSSDARDLDIDNYGVNETGEQKVLWSALINVSYLFNDNHKIRLNILHNHSGSKLANQRNIWSNYHDVTLEKRALLFVERAFTGINFNGLHKFKNRLKIDWMAATAFGSQSEPDFRIFENILDEIDGEKRYSIESSKHSSPTRFFRTLDETNSVGKIDAEYPFVAWQQSFKVKGGIGILNKNRNYSEKRYIYDSENSSFNGNVEEYLSDNNIGLDADTDEFGVYLIKINTKPYSYDANLNLVSSYGMLDVDLLNKLRVIVGARVEKSNYLIESKDKSKDKSEPEYLDILPSINTTYRLTNKINLRSSFNKTLARPSFRELSPVESYDFFNNETVLGQPDLKRSTINNLDLKFEYFPSSGEVLSIGGFAKYFDNPIEKVYMLETVNPTVTFINSDEATIYGIEFEMKKKLGFISPLLKNFKFTSNVTLVNSTVQISAEGYSDDKRRLAGQSPYVVNASLQYINPKIGTSGSLNFNVTGEKIAIVQPNITPNVMEQPTPQLDFVFKQKLNKYWGLTFKVKNILDSEKKKIYHHNGEETTYSSYKNGRTYSLGFSFKLN